MKTAIRLIALAAALVASRAIACGACVEDKIAATYDHAVVQRAAAEGNVMVFCELKGRIDGKQLVSASHRVKGLDTKSLRIAQNPPALSFALDAATESPEDAVAALQREVPQTQMAIIRLIESSSVPTN